MTSHPMSVAFAAVVASAAFALAASAASVGPISVSNAWSRPVAPGLPTGVAYLTLHNGGDAPERLLDATAPVAAHVSLHQSMDMGGMMSMTPVTHGLAIAPSTSVALAPGGYHLMLEGLKHGLKAGERYPLTLRFAHGKSVTVEVPVRTSAP